MKCPRCGHDSSEPFWDAFRRGYKEGTQLVNWSKKSSLRINIIGGGSAGQRHARMLRERGHVCTMIDLRTTPEYFGFDRPPKKEFPRCDAVVIATPPETHEHYLKMYEYTCPILCEGPVTAYPDHVHFPHMTASNWLFVPQIQALWQKLATTNAEPVSAHLWFDYDLARWRGPGWAYKESCYYESGIDLINCHEAMTALWLFGPADETETYKRITGKSKGFDALVTIVRHTNGVLTTINSGWHAASYQRGIRVVFKDGTVEEIGWNSPADDAICNQSYADMLDHWLKAIAENDCNVRPSLLDGYRAYKLMQGEAV